MYSCYMPAFSIHGDRLLCTHSARLQMQFIDISNEAESMSVDFPFIDR